MRDLKIKLKLDLGKQQALIVQNYDCLALIVSQAFGGQKEKERPTTVKATTTDEMRKAAQGMFGS